MHIAETHTDRLIVRHTQSKAKQKQQFNHSIPKVSIYLFTLYIPASTILIVTITNQSASNAFKKEIKQTIQETKAFQPPFFSFFSIQW